MNGRDPALPQTYYAGLTKRDLFTLVAMYGLINRKDGHLLSEELAERTRRLVDPFFDDEPKKRVDPSDL